MSNVPVVKECDEAFDSLPTLTLVPIQGEANAFVESAVIVALESDDGGGDVNYQAIITYLEGATQADDECYETLTFGEALAFATRGYGFEATPETIAEFDRVVELAF